MKGRVLIAAGSDSGGGAGIQADIKTVTALGGYAATAITALTAQDTRTVHRVHAVPADFVAEQMRVVLADIGADCIKTGMIHSVPIIEAIAETAARYGAGVPLVVDPVLVAKGGASLLEPSAMRALATRLIGQADLVTPNIPEAERLTGLTISTVDDMACAAEQIHRLGPPAVLVKGGHLDSDEITDLLSHPGGHRTLPRPPNREPSHPRHRLHPGLGHRHRHRARNGPCRRRGAGAAVPQGGHRGGAWLWRGPRAGQSRRDGDAHGVGAAFAGIEYSARRPAVVVRRDAACGSDHVVPCC